jgi:hypothetical protein
MLTSAIWANGIETGNAIPALQSGVFDLVFIMSYDTDVTSYTNYAQYITEFSKYISPSKIFVGLESPAEYGKHVTTVAEAIYAAQCVKNAGVAGIFTWYFNKSDGSPSETQLRAAVETVFNS